MFTKKNRNQGTCWQVNANKDNQQGWSISTSSCEISGLSTGVKIGSNYIKLPIVEMVSETAGKRIIFSNDLFRIALDIKKTSSGFLQIAAELINLSDEKQWLDTVVLAAMEGTEIKLAPQANSGNYRVLINGFDSWGKTGQRPWQKKLRNKAIGDIRADGHVTSGMLTAVWSIENTNALIIGSTGDPTYPAIFNWTSISDEQKEGFSVERTIETDISCGQSIRFAPIELEQSNDLISSLEDFSRRHFQKLQTPREMFYGWSSWDYYLNNPAMADIQENIRQIKTDALLSDKIRVIGIDMGWFNVLGDWRANIDFLSDRRAVAEHIIDEGFVPGIWLCPLLVSPAAKLVRYKKHWFIQEGNSPLNINRGDPLFNDTTYCLDFTVTEVQDYIFSLFSELYKEGYRYFKLDFLKTWMV